MKTFLILFCFGLCSYLALVEGQKQCTAYGKPCLDKSQLSPGFQAMYNGGPGPCLYRNGNKLCFTSTSGGQGYCDCDTNAACKCDNIITKVPQPGETCTVAPKDPSNCAALKKPYCAINSTTLACKTCGSVNMANCNKVCAMGITDQADITSILKWHNDNRRKVAKGLEDRGYPGPQPEAANMNQLVWDADLAHTAQMNANTCVYDHDEYTSIPNNPGQLGQNIAQSGASYLITNKDFPVVMRGWYEDEVVCMPESAASEVVEKNDCGKLGHYTQVVWAKTKKVGCGWIQYYKGSMYYQYMVCNYYPAANMPGEPVYIVGTPGSECPTGSNDGLCK